MGTRGYYVFRSKGVYYVFYNHFDSYFEGLGELIVKELRTLTTEDFRKMRRTLAGIKWHTNYRGNGYQGLMKLVQNPDDYDLFFVDENPPDLMDSPGCEYIYTVDLDCEVFSVDYKEWNDDLTECYPQEIKYPLENIPTDWIPKNDE